MNHFDNTNFQSEVLGFSGVTVVDFWASWCGPCMMLGPVLEEIAKEFENDSNVKIGKVNVDESGELAQKYGIMSIPNVKFLKNGQVVDEVIGLQSKEVFIEKIKALV